MRGADAAMYEAKRDTKELGGGIRRARLTSAADLAGRTGPAASTGENRRYREAHEAAADQQADTEAPGLGQV